MGQYTIKLSLFAFGWELPLAVSCSGTEKSGVPVEVSATLHFSAGRSAQFYAGYKSAYTQHAIITGEKQSIQWNDFVIPNNEHDASFQVSTSAGLRNDATKIDESSIQFRCQNEATQESCMFHNFSAAAVEKDEAKRAQQFDLFTSWALKTQAVLDACLQSMRSEGARTPVEQKL